MKKKMLSLALAAALCVGLLPTAAMAADDMGKVGEYSLISAGYYHTAAIDEEGALWMWGSNRIGMLGNGGEGNEESDIHTFYTYPIQTTPVKVMVDVVSVSCGTYCTAAIKKDGTLWMWGGSSNGQLGNGGTGNNIDEDGYSFQDVPIKVMDHVAAVSCGVGHTAIIKTDGSLWMCGKNDHGQLGNGSTAQTLLPMKVLDNVTAVSCGGDNTAIIKADGSLWMCGKNDHGQLGNGSTAQTLLPVKVLDDVAAVSCGGGHTAAIKTDGTLWMWGANFSGQLGNGGSGNAKDKFGQLYQTVPVKVLDNVVAVNCGDSATAAIKTDGTLWMWGINMYGRLGNGSTTNSSVPILVQYDVATVSCGDNATGAIKTDGTLWMWGGNFNGQLGNGTTEDSSIPQQLSRLTTPLGVRFALNGGMGTTLSWLKDGQTTLDVPQNPTRAGYTFAGWYTDEELTKPYNFNDKVTKGFTLFAKWVPVSSTATKTGKSQSVISLNGNTITLDAYSLKAANGGDVTYVKLRDVAALLENTNVKFNVDWKRGAIYVSTKTGYTTKNGTELKTIAGTDGSYKWNTAPVLFDGTTKALEGVVITDGKGGGHTFFKLRDLGEAIGFTVGWSREKGIFIETN